MFGLGFGELLIFVLLPVALVAGIYALYRHGRKVGELEGRLRERERADKDKGSDPK